MVSRIPSIKKFFLFLIIPVGLCLGSGCANTPAIYTMAPCEIETIRSDIDSVGIVLSEYTPKSEVLMPARGTLNGAQRGVVVGATLPVLLGLVSPIPGGVIAGVLVAPFTAVAGGIRGAVEAVPAEKVAAAEIMMEAVTKQVQEMGLRQEFVNRVIEVGSEKTDLTFVPLSGIGPNHPDQLVAYDELDLSEVDTILEIRVVESGLRGMYDVNPPTDAFIKLGVRLIRVRDNQVQLDETVYCMSEVQNTFSDWTDREGILLANEYRDCVPELAEKIIDDIFLVCPIPETKRRS